MDWSAAAVTLRMAEPLAAPQVDALQVAVIVVSPCASPEARPAAPMVAMLLADVVQSTSAVRSCVELSVKTPVAANWTCVPVATLAVAGVTSRRATVADVTVSVAWPAWPPNVAVIALVPGATPTALPLRAPTVATAGLPDVHAASAVTSRLLLSV